MITWCDYIAAEEGANYHACVDNAKKYGFTEKQAMEECTQGKEICKKCVFLEDK
jgi:hypothetical protein